ncbi:MAG: glycoside hydrolase family 2 protein [Bacteroidales bacterium]
MERKKTVSERNAKILWGTAFIILFVFAVFVFTIFIKGSATITILYPYNNLVSTNNSLTFLWKNTGKYDSFQIWVDSIRMDTVSGSQQKYVSFPLSFGKHSLFIVGTRGNRSDTSQKIYFSIDDKPLCKLPPKSQLLRHNWLVKAACEVPYNGHELTNGSQDLSNWAQTSIPATVLTALVRNGIYPNPYLGINNLRIPDASDEFNSKYDLLKYSHIQGKNPWKTPYWYYHSFYLYDTIIGKHYWLQLNEINYKAEIWLNGTKIADTSEVVGMERRFRFNVTHLIKAQQLNRLAIAIYPPDHPGMPDNEPLLPLDEPGTNMADGLISKDYTKWDVVGWDWQPPIRDRDMGITEDVFISATDDIDITNLYVSSDLPLPDTSKAELTTSFDLTNYGKYHKKGILKTSILFENREVTSFSKPFEIKPGSTASFQWSSQQVKELLLRNPKLWWPIGYGTPNLYQLVITAVSDSDDYAVANTRFGIRKVETYVGNIERIYKLNGRVIYPKGGNWVIDMMLNWTASRYQDEIALTRNAGINILRIWGPTGAPPTTFYDAADEQGVLLWQDFLNDYWGTFKNAPGYLPDEKLFELATIDIIKRYRNHPSLVIWCGGNEGPNPREQLIMNKLLPLYDGRDSKHYLRISNGDGLHGGGPYHTLLPEKYFVHPNLMGFSSEIGPSGVPVYESMTKFITDLGKNYKEGYFPLNGQMAYHDATDRSSDDRKFSHYHHIVQNCYGNPKNVEDYFSKCQLVNYDVYRASIEAINRLLWNKASGMALWKSNSSWPSMTWQIYDWYLQAHAGYYGTKKATENVHIQYNRDTREIVVLNTHHNAIDGMWVNATLFDKNINIIWTRKQLVSLIANGITQTHIKLSSFNDVSLLKLELFDPTNNLISENIYWLSDSNRFTELNSLKPGSIKAKATKAITKDQIEIQLTLNNTGKGVVFFTEIALVEQNTLSELLPTFYSDNYITLFPNETKTIRITSKIQQLPLNYGIKIRPYNFKEHKLIPLQ